MASPHNPMASSSSTHGTKAMSQVERYLTTFDRKTREHQVEELFKRLKRRLKNLSLTDNVIFVSDNSFERLLLSKVYENPSMAAELRFPERTMPCTKKILASQAESKPTTPTLLPLKEALPQEIWLIITSHFRSPRILYIIEHNGQICLDSESSQLEIPGALFVDTTTHQETLKTHTIAFGQVPGLNNTRSSRFLPKPILFNTNTDILFRTEAATLKHFNHMSSAVARKDKVRFVAIPARLVYATHTSYTGDILAMIRRFGTLEKLFVVGRRCQEHINALQLALDKRMMECEANWSFGEAKGMVFAGKWKKPVLCHLGWEEDLLEHVN